MKAGSNSAQGETKRGSAADLSGTGWRMTVTGMGTGMMTERTARVTGENGEGGPPTGTGTETWRTGADAVAATETEKEIREIESLVERRRRTEERKSQR